MGKYFGTDGVRGVAGADLTCEMAMLIGRGAAAVLTSSTGHKPRILIGRLRRMGTHIGSVLRCRQSEKKTSVYVLYADSDGFR